MSANVLPLRCCHLGDVLKVLCILTVTKPLNSSYRFSFRVVPTAVQKETLITSLNEILLITKTVPCPENFVVTKISLKGDGRLGRIVYNTSFLPLALVT